MMKDFVTVEWAPASDPTDLTPTWVDITSIVQSVDVTGGRSGVFDLYGPRTATIVCLNGTKSPVVAPTFAIGGFYRWRQIRVMTVGTDAVFTGYILTVEHDQTNAPFSGLVTIDCTDKLGVLAQAEFKPTDIFGSTVNGLTNTVDLQDAVANALTLCGLDSTVNLSGPSTALFKLPDEPSGQILQWLQDVLEAEVGGVQIAATGVPAVNGRWDPFGLALSDPSMTFSDTAAVDEFQYLRENLTLASTDTDYYNRAIAQSSYSDATFTVENVPTNYPKETISRTDLPFVYQSWAEANAALYAKLYGQAVTYPRTLVVFMSSAHEERTVVDFLVGVTNVFGDSHVVVKQTPVGDTQKTYHVTIENAHHTITPDIWTCELGFGSLDRWIDAYGDGSAIYELVELDGDSAHGWDSAAILAP